MQRYEKRGRCGFGVGQVRRERRRPSAEAPLPVRRHDAGCAGKVRAQMLGVSFSPFFKVGNLGKFCAFLKEHAWPDNPEAPIDELARDIIWRELKSHAIYRTVDF